MEITEQYEEMIGGQLVTISVVKEVVDPEFVWEYAMEKESGYKTKFCSVLTECK